MGLMGLALAPHWRTQQVSVRAIQQGLVLTQKPRLKCAPNSGLNPMTIKEEKFKTKTMWVMTLRLTFGLHGVALLTAPK